MILRDFTKPTNVLILGTYIESDFTTEIDSDYCDVKINFDSNQEELEIDGFFTILTKKELKKFLKDYDEDDCRELDVFLIENFVGSIEFIDDEIFINSDLEIVTKFVTLDFENKKITK